MATRDKLQRQSKRDIDIMIEQTGEKITIQVMVTCNADSEVKAVR